MNTDERYVEIKKRIFQTQCLIIDEVSMINVKTLGQVEFILRKTLPPVENELYGNSGKLPF